MTGPFTVAIDGPAASGKGTIARRVADTFGFAHLDTGLLYRAVGRKVLDGKDPESAARNLSPEDLFDEETLRTPDVAQAASRVAAIPAVRQALTDFQVSFARRSGGAVLDGRDIGTVICPDADVKFFVTASDAVRAERRHLELSQAAKDVTLQEVLEDLRQRDARDAERSEAPMKPAADAIRLDTTEMSVDDAVDLVLRAVRSARSQDETHPEAPQDAAGKG